MVEERLLTRKVCVTVVAAAACALVCASAAARPDVSSVGTVLSPRQYYGPGGPVYANELYRPGPAHAQHQQAVQHQLAHMCFGTDCADVPPAFAKALISTEKGAYAQAYQDGESAERREMSAAKPHQVGDVINGMRPMRVATLKDRVGEHEQMVAAPPAKPLWHSQWQKLFGAKKAAGMW
eukprot:CAMPEP_0179433504 /NCGR_PEP_ID=MMETSP0799-20121207/17907_1 /TAXON_ID=46947 /ORGANISM="Geminigera cryophila, Strain CCMP2564" /LENGTH=179 /DNA_ID=CAMNT_0021211527 /DNA_START=14 /DNA_END=553 /DNA_ORIENTATION=+